MVVFKVLEPGLLTTVQDLGRFGFQQFGVPVAGAMDSYALRIANYLVGNDGHAAGLEVTLTGPALQVTKTAVIAITGGDLTPLMNDKSIPMWETVAVQSGDILTFAGWRSGCRAYLAVAGGVDVPVIMGSRATYLRGSLGGLEGRRLKAGDCLAVGGTARKIAAGTKVPAELIPKYAEHSQVSVILGPQHDHFPPESIEVFLNAMYSVTDEADRMGYRLAGAKIIHKSQADIISDGIAPGSVQIPGHGMPIIMLADRQTIGGYTKIATIISSDLCKVAQAKPGDTISFASVSIDTAHGILAATEQKLASWERSLVMTGCGCKRYVLSIDGQAYHVELVEC